MLSRLPRFLLLSALLALAAPRSSAAPSSPPLSEKIISMDVTAGDLQAVAATLERQAHIQILVIAGPTPFKPVYVHLEDATLPKALRTIANSAGASVSRNVDGVYVFTPIVAVNPAAQAPPEDAAKYHWHSLVLQHAKPGDILTQMHWEGTGDAAAKPELPEGVARIFALQSNNSLLISATDEGFQQVKRIVSALDIAPKQVQLKTLFAAIPASQKLTLDLADPLGALLQLQKANAMLYQPPLVTANNGEQADIPFEMPLPRLERNLPPWSLLINQATQTNSLEAIPTLRVTARINSDNSVSLMLNSGEPAAANLRTVPSDGMTAYDVTGLPHSAGYRVFLFVMPTIIGESNDSAASNANGGSSVTVTP